MFEVRVAGPDDVHTHDDELSALLQANEINKAFLADLLKHTNPADQVLCVATVHEVAAEEQPWMRDNERTLLLLLLCGGHDVTEEVISGWTDEQCQQAEDWASREHLAASDNDDVERVPMPPHVRAHPPKPLTGNSVGDLWT